MKYKFLATVVLVMGIFALTGCTAGMVASSNNSHLLRLELGQSKKDVTRIMGYPERNERYLVDSKDMEVWFYRTDVVNNNIDNPYSSMIFQNGKLIGWGNNFYERTIKYKVGSEKSLSAKPVIPAQEVVNVTRQ
jgi:hypothetical protein